MPPAAGAAARCRLAGAGGVEDGGAQQRGDRAATGLLRADGRAQVAAHSQHLGPGESVMSEAARIDGGLPTLTAAERQDAICDRFEKAWQAEQAPRLEAFLQGAPEVER